MTLPIWSSGRSPFGGVLGRIEDGDAIGHPQAVAELGALDRPAGHATTLVVAGRVRHADHADLVDPFNRSIARRKSSLPSAFTSKPRAVDQAGGPGAHAPGKGEERQRRLRHDDEVVRNHPLRQQEPIADRVERHVRGEAAGQRGDEKVERERRQVAMQTQAQLDARRATVDRDHACRCHPSDPEGWRSAPEPASTQVPTSGS